MFRPRVALHRVRHGNDTFSKHLSRLSTCIHTSTTKNHLKGIRSGPGLAFRSHRRGNVIDRKSQQSVVRVIISHEIMNMLQAQLGEYLLQPNKLSLRNDVFWRIDTHQSERGSSSLKPLFGACRYVEASVRSLPLGGIRRKLYQQRMRLTKIGWTEMRSNYKSLLWEFVWHTLGGTIDSS